jgi:hypothetical protein
MRPVINVTVERQELDFYKDYFLLLNIKREDRLSGREIDLAAALAYEDMHLETNSKNAKNFNILKELTGMSSSMLSQYIVKLAAKGILVKNEDGLTAMTPALRQMIKAVKAGISGGKNFEFDYVLRYTING